METNKLSRFQSLITRLKIIHLHSFRVCVSSRMSGKDSLDEDALEDGKSAEEDGQITDGSGEGQGEHDIKFSPMMYVILN